MKPTTILWYVLLGLAVIILGALAGWYFFLHAQTSATSAVNTARGFGAQTPVGSPGGNTGTGLSSAPWAAGATTSASLATGAPAQLWRVTKSPVGGIGFATSTQGARLRFVERATGYIFEADPVNGTVARLTNTLMPKIYEASFSSNNRVVERSLDASGAITTYAGFVGSAATSSPLSGTSLPRNIAAFAPDPKTSQVLYLQVKGSGVIGMTSAWSGSQAKQVFSSATPDWRVLWLSDGRIILAQKAADSLAGYAYTLKNGTLNPLLGPLPGLIVLPRSGSQAMLYSTASGGGVSLFMRISATTTTTRLAIVTVADKCVWSPGAALVAYCAVPQTPPTGNFLDAWYRGEVHPSDALWRVDAGAGQAQLIFTPPSVSLDITTMTIDDSGNYLAFMNAADQSAWLLRINK